MTRTEMVTRIIDATNESRNNLMVLAYMTDDEILQTYNELYNIQ